MAPPSFARLLIVIAVALVACSPSATQTSSPSVEATQTRSAVPTEEPALEPTPDQATWEADAVEHRAAVGERFTYRCEAPGEPNVIWGTDTYTDDSSVCTAAVHAGLITYEDGGAVTIEMRPGQASYEATNRNGVVSQSWASWDGSFVFVTD